MGHISLTSPRDVAEMVGADRENQSQRIQMLSSGEYSAHLLTVSEIAQTLRVPVSWVYERTRRRGLERMPHIKLGKYLRFDPNTVSEWLKSMREN
jgi:excisionase family DNA binding protein